MGVIDFILNATCLLLWLNWRATRSMFLPRPGGESLLGTLRRADPPGAKRWLSLIALVLLLAIRAPVYWWIGPGARWTPKLPLNIISLSFRSDLLDRMLLYSFLGFGLALTAFFLWLLLLSVVNRRVSDSDV